MAGRLEVSLRVHNRGHPNVHQVRFLSIQYNRSLVNLSALGSKMDERTHALHFAGSRMCGRKPRGNISADDR